MKTVGEVIDLSSKFLEERKLGRPKRFAEEIVSSVLKLKRVDLYLQYDRPLIDPELTLLRERLKRCGKGEPLEYVIGEVEFFGANFKVGPEVLIPRPETELLVEIVSKRAKKGILWDLCTGSGCIGISLKRVSSELTVTLSDISKEALEVAKENGAGLELEFLQGDLWEPFLGKRADFIVSNPPYVSKKEYEELPQSVKDFEPKLALLGGDRGVEFYERIEGNLSSYLNPGGTLFLEIGSTQGSAVQQIFRGKGAILKDWAGHDRFFTLDL